MCCEVSLDFLVLADSVLVCVMTLKVSCSQSSHQESLDKIDLRHRNLLDIISFDPKAILKYSAYSQSRRKAEGESW